jgi:hypothetical protein
MRNPKVAACVFFVFTTAGCDLTQEPPRGTDRSWEGSTEGFSLTTHASLNLALVEDRLNTEVPSQLHTIDDNIGKCLSSTKTLKIYDGYKTTMVTNCLASVSVHAKGPVQRNGRIRVSGSGDTLRVEVPVKAHAKLTPRGDVGKATGLRETAEASLVATATARLGVKQDWSPDITISTDFTWDKRAQIEVLGIPITFGSQAEKPIQEKLRALAAQVSRVVPPELVRSTVLKGWRLANTPTQLLKEPAVWLKVEPTTIRYTGVDVQTNIVRTHFNIQGTGRVSLGARPATPSLPPLPRLETVQSVTPDSEVVLPIVVPYSMLAEALRSQLAGTWFHVDDDKIDAKLIGSAFRVIAIDVYPSKDSLVLGAKLRIDVPGRWLDLRGSLFAVIKPRIDHATRTVHLDQLELTAVTDSTFINATAITLLKTGIVDAIRPFVTFNYAKRFDEVVEKATSAMNAKPAADVSLRTTVQRVDVNNDAVVTKEGLVVVANMQLRSEVTVGH